VTKDTSCHYILKTL